MKYIGVILLPENEKAPTRMVYPDGQFSFINQEGQLAIVPIGSEKGIPVTNIVTFTDVDNAVAWIKDSV